MQVSFVKWLCQMFFKIITLNYSFFFSSSKEYNTDIDESKLIDCTNGQSYEKDLKEGKSCRFNYKELFASTPCSEDKQYGYATSKPCVLVKLNKMIDFIPQSSNDTVVKIVCSADVILNLFFLNSVILIVFTSFKLRDKFKIEFPFKV